MYIASLDMTPFLLSKLSQCVDAYCGSNVGLRIKHLMALTDFAFPRRPTCLATLDDLKNRTA